MNLSFLQQKYNRSVLTLEQSWNVVSIKLFTTHMLSREKKITLLQQEVSHWHPKNKICSSDNSDSRVPQMFIQNYQKLGSQNTSKAWLCTTYKKRQRAQSIMCIVNASKFFTLSACCLDSFDKQKQASDYFGQLKNRQA